MKARSVWVQYKNPLAIKISSAHFTTCMRFNVQVAFSRRSEGNHFTVKQMEDRTACDLLEPPPPPRDLAGGPATRSSPQSRCSGSKTQNRFPERYRVLQQKSETKAKRLLELLRQTR